MCWVNPRISRDLVPNFLFFLLDYVINLNLEFHILVLNNFMHTYVYLTILQFKKP